MVASHTSSMTDAWLRLPLSALFGEGVMAAQVRLEDTLEPLHPEEEIALGRARPERLLEFRAGRHAAREALALLGVGPVPIPRDTDRAPIWPRGVVGTITHVRREGIGWAGAAAAHLETWQAVGLDAELDSPLEAALWRRVLTPSELERLRQRDEDEQGIHAKVIFSAKECVYKCQYTLTRQFLEFADVDVELANETFRARFRPDSVTRAMGGELEGRFLRQSGLIVTGTALARR
jgi:4'-phosphopantetheinyl transferase EntD